MNERILEIACRIREMRDILEIPVEDMAELLDLSAEDYLSYEEGTKDFSFTFLYKVANKFQIDMTDLLTGRSPSLAEYFVVRKGQGIPIARREGFKYESLAYNFKDRFAQAFLVTAKYDEEESKKDFPLSRHEGQEFNYIIKGSLRFMVSGYETILNEGDSVYYNSNLPHGMVAHDEDCTFMAMIMNERSE